jgi:hypothetical protein
MDREGGSVGRNRTTASGEKEREGRERASERENGLFLEGRAAEGDFCQAALVVVQRP